MTSLLGYLNPLSYFSSKDSSNPEPEKSDPQPESEENLPSCEEQQDNPPSLQEDNSGPMEEERSPIGPALETPGSPDVHCEVVKPVLEEVEEGQDPLSCKEEEGRTVASAGGLVITERPMTEEEIEEFFGSDEEPPAKVSKGNLPCHLNPDNLIQIMAYEEVKHFPQPVVFDFCPGQRRMPFGQWWVPEGKTPAECTICEYCYNNKCLGDVVMTPYYHKHFNISGNYQEKIPYSKMKNGNCNCDCPKMKEHPRPDNLLCPPCYTKSLSIFCRAASCGSCQQCGNWTSYCGMAYCPPCSHLLKACHECGQPLKEGDAYLEELEASLDKEIARSEKYMTRDPEMKDYYTEEITKLKKRKEKVVARFSGKSAEEILVMAKNNYEEA